MTMPSRFFLGLGLFVYIVIGTIEGFGGGLTKTLQHGLTEGIIRPPASASSPSSTSLQAAAITALPSPSFMGGVQFPTTNSNRPNKAATRAKISNAYSLFDMIVGPLQSDCNAVACPGELKELAEAILQSTSHISRRGRINILEALIWSYDAYRLQDASLRSMTVGQYVARVAKVAVMLGHSEVDSDTIIAALLCQSALKVEDVESVYGSGVATILKGWQAMLRVESELEIKALIYDYAKRLWGEEGDNLRNLLLLMAQDWRAVALRVAWKRVEMEGPFASKKEQIDASWACLNIYASLAEKAGMSLIKNEIEDRAFRFLMPQEYRRVSSQLAERQQDVDVLKQAKREVLQALMEDEIFLNLVERVEVKGRVKSPYSVWKKTKCRGCSVEDIHDMVALRIVCTPATEPGDSLERKAEKGAKICNYVLHHIVHKIRPHYVGRVKDYISKPKANGYQSLHTTLQMRLRGRKYPFEVQIRTQNMHHIAEHGLAAHAVYKGDKSLGEVIEKGSSSRKAVVEEEEGSRAFKGKGDFLNWVQRMLAESQVIVFDPDGKLVKMSRGSTLLDAVKTYQLSKKVSTEVLRKMRLNGRRAELDRELATGDVLSF